MIPEAFHNVFRRNCPCRFSQKELKPLPTELSLLIPLTASEAINSGIRHKIITMSQYPCLGLDPVKLLWICLYQLRCSVCCRTHQIIK